MALTAYKPNTTPPLPPLAPVEHGVESGHLINAHRYHPHDGGDLVHRRHGQPASILPLRKVQQGNNSRSFVVGRIPMQNHIDALVVLLKEFSDVH